MSNLTLIPIPINTGGSSDVDWKFFLLGMLVTFVFVIVPCLIYFIRSYLKHKREYPMLYFDWQSYLHPLPVIITGIYIGLAVTFGLMGITEWLYNLL